MLKQIILAAVYSAVCLPVMGQNTRVIFTINSVVGLNLSPSINAQGHVVFTSNSGSNVWTDASGSLQIVASKSMVAPGSALNYSWGNAGHICQIADSNKVVVPASLTPGQGIWSGAAAPLNVELITPVSSPGLPSGISLSSIDEDRFLVNSQSAILFNGLLSGVGVVNNTASALLAVRSQQLSMVARAGDPAPGLPAGAVFGADCFASGSGFYSMNDGGDACFSGSVTQGLGGSYLGQGLWLQQGGVTGLIAKRGDAVPGSATLTILDAGRVAMNNQRDVLFQANLSNSSFGLMLKPAGGGLQTIGKTGDAAPGASANFQLFSKSAINHNGQIAFQATLSGAGITSSNDQIVYTKQPGGALVKLLREKEQLPGGLPGELVYTDTSTELTPVMNANGYTVLLCKIASSPIGREYALTAFDASGNLSRLICSGDSLEVSPGNFQTISFLSLCAGDFGRLFQVGTGGEDGFRSPLNDSNQLAFYAGFTNGTSGVVVTTIPEPASMAACLAIVAGLASRLRSSRAR